MKLIIITLALLFSGENLWAKSKKEILRIAYFKPIFGHVHRNASPYSSSLTTISCGHPIKVYKIIPKSGRPVTVFNKKFHFVKVGPYEGYVSIDYLSEKKVDCFQDRYPKFFDELDMDLTELYYWGRLYDQFIFGKSRVQ